MEILIAEMWTTGTSERSDANPSDPIGTRAEAVMAVLSAAQLDQWLNRQGHSLDELIPQIQTIVTAIAAR